MDIHDNYNISEVFPEENLINLTYYEDPPYSDSCEPCEKWYMQKYLQIYSKRYHIYVSIVISFLGTVSNIVNVKILNKKNMTKIPINRILKNLAVSDMLVMIDYIIFALYYYVILPAKMNYPFWGAVFVLIHVHFSQVFHTLSICLTVTLAIWRYIVVGHPDKNRVLCTDRRCSTAIKSCYILSVLLCIPCFLLFEVRSTTIVEDKEYTLYHVALSDLALQNVTYLVGNLWAYAVFIKLLPCMILSAITGWLLRTLSETKSRKYVLKNYDQCYLEREKNQNGYKTTDRTTKMLVAVLVLFLITEFPQAIIGLLMGVKGKCFFIKCYQEFAEVFDVLALLNGTVSFVLYCSMNKMFRTHFKQFFVTRVWAKLSTVTYVAPENQSTITIATTSLE